MHLDGELWGARSTVRPNTGHEAIKRLADEDRLAGVVTQNVDGLHLVSGLDDDQVAELHGNVRKSLCVDCAQVWDTEIVLAWVEAGELDPGLFLRREIAGTHWRTVAEARVHVASYTARMLELAADAEHTAYLENSELVGG